MEVIIGMSFLTLSKVKVEFAGRQFTWKAYITAKALPTTQRVQIISLKEFAKVALDLEQEAFVVYVATLFQHLEQRVQIAALIADKAPVIVWAKYSEFKNVFFKKSAALLPKHPKINIYVINLKEGKQPPYEPIYSLGLVELETLKIYIKTNLANSFICSLKSPPSTLILFDKKANKVFDFLSIIEVSTTSPSKTNIYFHLSVNLLIAQAVLNNSHNQI